MSYPKIVKSRDLELFRKELELVGGSMRKLSRSRMIVGDPSQMPVVYRRTRKKWLLVGDLCSMYPDYYVWLDTHTHTYSWGRVAVDYKMVTPPHVISVKIKI